MSIFDVITLFGGLGMFLYGMSIMGSGLEKAAGSKTEGILKKLTSSTIKGVALGAAITALIQSSSGTTVIVIGLVNSGIMKFAQAVGIIMGANIGTTVTGQILRLSDISSSNVFLQLLKPSSLAPMLTLAGGVMYVFLHSAKKRNIGQIMLGLGLLFFGMSIMEGAVRPLRESPWFAQLFTALQNPILGVLAGALVTAAIQSSSASIGILQALTSTGAVTWGNAVPIILGQNIGTCITAMLASIGASKAAKRVAFSHLYFNLIGTAIWLAGIYSFKALVGISFWSDSMNMGAVANFHTLFNLLTTLFFIPFSRILVKLSEMTVPDKKTEKQEELEPVVLDLRLYQSPSVAIAQARKAVVQMGEVARANQTQAVSLLFKPDAEQLVMADHREDMIDRLDVSITNYLVNMSQLELSEYETKEINILLNFVTEFERIGDYAVNIIERSGEIKDKEIHFSTRAQYELAVLNDAVSEVFALTVEAFAHGDMEVARKVEPLEETIDVICQSLRDHHIQRLQDGSCNIQAGIIFLEVLTDYERISDHCSNVAARLLCGEEEGEINLHVLRRNLHKGGDEQYDKRMKSYTQKYYDKLSMPIGE